MITINFFKDGAYIKGHDTPEVCTLISYAMWSCINDCIDENEDVYHYQSANDSNWSYLGFTYIKINTDIEEHKKIYNKFKDNISYWIEELLPHTVKIVNRLNDEIDWFEALADAKCEAGITT